MTKLNENYIKKPDTRCGDCQKYKFNLKICGNAKSDHYAHLISPVHPSCEKIVEKE